MKRLWELDATRGLMLVLMTITHVPTRLTDPVGQPFGFVSAAEGFVLLSSFVAGLIYSRIGYTQGVDVMRRAFWQRALKIYTIQAALLLFLFTVITALGLKVDHPEIREMVKYYLAHPHDALVYSLLLVYQPAFLDILPMYILFMLMSPWVIAHAMRHGWQWPMALSATVWAAAQFGSTQGLYTFLSSHLHVPVPYNETGSFDTLAWQFLWLCGMWLGASRSAPGARPLVFPRWLLNTAIAVATACFSWRHFGPTGQAPFGSDAALNLLFDKWHLGPLRLVNLAALCIVAIRFGPTWLRQLPRPRWLEALGSASLPVFCAHLVAVFLALSLIGRNNPAMGWWDDIALLATVFASLYAVARWVLARGSRARPQRSPAASDALPTTATPLRPAALPSKTGPG
ncbi:MAG: OpgC domain-containing protein [Pseudomonadota bacterium]